MKRGFGGASGASIAALALLWAISFGAAGCYDSENCAETFSCEPPPASPPPCAGDPATTPAKEECGVFVARHGDDARAGTRQEPVRTLQHAVQKALLEGKPHVYACAEDFHEAVRLPSGVEIWGGRACEREDWAFLGADHPTVVAPPAGRVPVRVHAHGAVLSDLFSSDPRSLLFGVRVVAADAIEPGGSSIALIVTDDAEVEVRWSEIFAGNGAPGAPGEDAPLDVAEPGARGNHGAAACSEDLVDGALPAVTLCPDGSASIGGRGGFGDRDAGGGGENGAVIERDPALAPLVGGQGGKGVAGTDACGAGEAGQDGAAGASGEGGEQKAARASAEGWHGAWGEAGTPGTIGRGGGGGGGTRGRGVCASTEPQGGASGGSGGGGGCGGRGGGAGQAGGSSIGILTVGAEVVVEHSWIAVGMGGDGGRGGRGQAGGYGWPGGIGGAAGMNDRGQVEYACEGGHGGRGGPGGGGGGGLGGYSLAVARVHGGIDLKESTFVALDEVGRGGASGGSDPRLGRGDDGLAQEIWSLEQLIEPPR
ncbi:MULTISPECIES: hypothetical protein [Sorangium]|uniref:Uncharacterized protein n=1 Tax=Sorangium cellulosum TaxID=56 RepID=A0A4P2QZ16_SORCE|nr:MULTISPECIES: hypothetical protein [Sorangium]AUX35827.1 hypothetical protein SOCE836_080280 [Sorangium cellulosum]WCQ95126.1 hypothetical protein NQZ70_07901 [Sorangium sp. Soce836]